MFFLISFNVGMFLPIFEPYLLEYGVEEKNIGLWYSIYTVTYLIVSLIMLFPYTFKKSRLIAAGCFLMSLAYFLFEANLSMVAISLVILGCGVPLMNSNNYIVPTVPHMVEIAHAHYNLPEDDRVNDSISSITTIFISLGEVVGPIVGSFLPMYFGYINTIASYGFLVFAYAIFYVVCSDAFKDIIPHKEEKVLETALVEF